MSHIEIGAVNMLLCDASVDSSGKFNVGIARMDIELKQLAWRYKQRNWPHTANEGNAVGKTSASFNVSIDMSKDQDHLFDFKMNQIDVSLGAKHHKWLMGALMKLTKLARPIVSAVVHHEAKKVLDKSLGTIRAQGGCVFLQGALKKVDFVKFQFTSYEPTKVHIPVVGDVYVSVNSTYVHQPTSMLCEHVAFNGQILTAHIKNVPFDAGFKWSYRKQGSSFWHNQGTGVTNVVGATLVHIDLLKPTATVIKVDLPVLKLHIDAESDAWLYHALTSTMTPLIRESLQLFGGKVMAHEISKCLEDPTCPQLKPKAPHTALPLASATMLV